MKQNSFSPTLKGVNFVSLGDYFLEEIFRPLGLGKKISDRVWKRNTFIHVLMFNVGFDCWSMKQNSFSPALEGVNFVSSGDCILGRIFLTIRAGERKFLVGCGEGKFLYSDYESKSGGFLL